MEGSRRACVDCRKARIENQRRGKERAGQQEGEVGVIIIVARIESRPKPAVDGAVEGDILRHYVCAGGSSTS